MYCHVDPPAGGETSMLIDEFIKVLLKAIWAIYFLNFTKGARGINMILLDMRYLLRIHSMSIELDGTHVNTRSKVFGKERHHEFTRRFKSLVD